MLTQVRYSLALLALFALPVLAGLNNDNAQQIPSLGGGA